ncbi:hypothetical protein RJ641_025522 [Dillenia turbinata]|uniref:Plasma membrane fusion protein PRM1 n=1 Tax=Dillenia turbinata TaxID=194707 RepID=A0AAN8W1R9_9MAGN
MLCFSRSNLLIYFVVFLTLFCYSDGYGHHQTSHVSENNVRRFLDEANSSLILAAERTRRKDPLDHFKYYTGGWNISDEHYLASVGLTAAPFFVIAAVWFVVFGLSLSLICLCYCCCRREPYGYSRLAYALALICLILFTVAAIAGCVVLYTSQGKFHSSTTNTLHYVVNQANNTYENLQDVSHSLSSAKQIGIGQTTLPPSVRSTIDQIDAKINSSSNSLHVTTSKNAHDIQEVFDNVRVSLIVLAAVMLLLAFLGFLCSIFGLQCLVYLSDFSTSFLANILLVLNKFVVNVPCSLVILGWILVTGTFILCGVFLLLHNYIRMLIIPVHLVFHSLLKIGFNHFPPLFSAIADTCVAMDEWVQNPTAHTALDDILPCVDNATAQFIMTQSEGVTSQLVDMVNTVITNVSNLNATSNPNVFFNQSGPLMPTLCNPFNTDLTPRQCQVDEVTLDNATQVWKSYQCEVSSTGICATQGRVTPTMYNQMTATVNVSNALYHYGPFLINLVDCTFVRDTFTDIGKNYCPGLRKDSEWIYIGLVMVSAAVMFSLIFWVIYARERRHRVYTKQHMARESPNYYEKHG